MPNPIPHIHAAGLVGKWQLPTPHMLNVLKHMNYPDKPALIRTYHTHPYVGTYSMLMDSESGKGWRTQVDVESMIHSGWIKEDAEATAALGNENLSAWRITPAGQEAIAQWNVHNRLRAEVQALLEGMLAQERAAVGLPVVAKKKKKGL